MMKKYIQIGLGLGLVGSSLFLSGCTGKSPQVNQIIFTAEHPLYISFNDDKQNFNDSIQNHIDSSSIAFRIDNLKAVNVPQYYKKGYSSWFYGTDKGFNCDNKKFGSEEIADYNIGENLLFGVGSFGLIPLVSGFPHADNCIFLKEEYEQYIYQWLSKKKVDRKKILSLYSKLVKLYAQEDKYGNQIRKILNIQMDGLHPQLDLNCKLDSCIFDIENKISKIKKINKENQYIISELMKSNKPYTSQELIKILSNIQYTGFRSPINEKVKLLKEKEKKETAKKRAMLIKSTLESIKNDEFYNEWEKIKWHKNRDENGWVEGKGNFDKNGWPEGKGIFSLRNILKWDYLSGTDVAAYTEIEVTIKNHKFLDGKVISYVLRSGFLYTSEYTKTFTGESEMYDAAKETYEKAIKEYNNHIYSKNHHNSNKSIKIGNCHNINDGKTMCDIYVNGHSDGNIFYYYKDNHYEIFILGSNNASSNAGGYNPSLNKITTAKCGDSSIGSVNSISQALEMYANCGINGSY